MSSEHIIALLIAERDRLNRAIEALREPAKRRGRPPKDAPPTQRKAQVVRKKARWAKRKMSVGTDGTGPRGT